MIYYRQLGTIPAKRHVAYRRSNGELYSEEVFGEEGFSSKQAILYHIYPPTEVTAVEPGPEMAPVRYDDGCHAHRHLRAAELSAKGDPITSRRVLLYNDDVTIGQAIPEIGASMDYWFRNARADELYFVQEGHGALASVFGLLSYRPGDYVLIPRGTTYQWRPEREPQRWFVVEASGALDTPRRYRNEHGQLLEHAPYSERDFIGPATLETIDRRGDHRVLVKLRDRTMWYTLGHHPFDVVGWDGYLYPVTFNIANFEPITKAIHAPPPVHQTFQGPGFVVCSFCPRKLDYYPDAVPAPYVHSNIDSDEVLLYLQKYGPRRGVDVGSITLHPGGIPHGPHPGTIEPSIGKERTEELMVMIDTFRPLRLTTSAAEIQDESYPLSWRLD